MELCKSRISRHFSTGLEIEELAVLLLLLDEPETGLRGLVAVTDLGKFFDSRGEDFGNVTLETDFQLFL